LTTKLFDDQEVIYDLNVQRGLKCII